MDLRDIMTRNVEVVSAGASLKDAAKKKTGSEQTQTEEENEALRRDRAVNQ